MALPFRSLRRAGQGVCCKCECLRFRWPLGARCLWNSITYKFYFGLDPGPPCRLQIQEHSRRTHSDTHTQIHTLTVRCKAAIRKGKKAHSHFPYSKTKNPESCEPNWRQLPRSRLSGNSTIIAMLHLVSVLVCPCCFIKTISSSRLLELTMDVLFIPHRSVSICVYACVCSCVCETMSPQGSHKCSPSSCCVYVSVSLHSSVSDCAQPSTVAQN